jgi:8-oxo-dGTP diphosphatase
VTRRGERAFLTGYDAHAYPPFALTVDLAIFTIRDGQLSMLLVRRGGHPYRGFWALPGGHVIHGKEDAEAAARRELAEESGLDWTGHFEQLATYSSPDRDPRIKAGLHVASVAWVALAADLPDPVAGTDADQARFWPVEDLGELDLAFDHNQIAVDALERVRAKLEYTTVATQFVTEPFTLADLRRVYAAVWGQAPDLANFRRKVLSVEGFVVPTDETAPPIAGRPPQLYRRGEAERIDPPFIRPG